MSLPRFSVNNPVLVNMLMLVIVVTGGLLAMTMVREMFPESRADQLSITTVYPGIAPEDLEKTVTIKIEEAVRDVRGIDLIDSSVSEGMSTTVLTLDSDVTDPDRVLQDVKSEIDAIPDLPSDIENTTVRRLQPNLPVIAIAVYGRGSDAARKREARKLRDELLRLPGVSEVRMTGARDDEISIEVQPDRLREYDVTFEEVAQAIRVSNLDMTGGQLEGFRSRISVRTLGEEQRGVNLGSIVVRSRPDGSRIHLADVATVRDEFVESDIESFYDSLPSIGCVVYKTASQDAIRISSLVKAHVKGQQQEPYDVWGFQAAAAQPWYVRPFSTAGALFSKYSSIALGYPDPEAVYKASLANPGLHNFKLALHTDLARFVQGRIDLMVGNGLQGLFLVLVSMVLFLNWRIAFWAAAGIPVTFLGTFVVMSMLGQSINLISLMGLIIVMSIDVDEAIVISENIYRYLEMGYSPREAAIRGAEEVQWPVIVMTGTTIGAFIPLLFMDGQLGNFLRVLPMVAASAMTVSMIEALVILPSHLGELPPFAIKPAKSMIGAAGHAADVAGAAAGTTGAAVTTGAAAVTTGSSTSGAAARVGLFQPLWQIGMWLTDVRNRVLGTLVDVWFDAFVRLSIRWHYVTLAASVATLFFALGLVEGGFVPTVYIQKMDSETLVAALEMPIGTPASVTRERLQALSDFAVAQPEVTNVQMFTSLLFDLGGQGAVGTTNASHVGQIIIELRESTERTRTSEQLLTSLRQESSRLSGVNSVVWKSLQGGPAGKAIEVRLTSERFEDAVLVAENLMQRIQLLRGVYDLDDDLDRGLREVRLRLRDSAESTGITVAALGNTVRHALYGVEARRITRDREDVRIMVRYPKVFRQDVYHLESMWIPTPTAAGGGHNWVPFSEVAAVTESEASNSIHRSQQQKSVTISADVDDNVANGTDILTVLQTWFEEELRPKYPAVRFEVLGSSRETTKALNSLKIALPVSLLLIYMLLAGLFRSYLQPLVVMVAVPFGWQGAVFGHWLMGSEMTIMSYIGLIALNGIVVNDSLVLVDFINNQVRAGLSPAEACVAGSKLRLRAIILTTVTTAAGITPLMMETSFQARFLIPLAITLAFGLLFATVLTLITVPALNMVFYDVGWLFRLLTGGTEHAGPDPST